MNHQIKSRRKDIAHMFTYIQLTLTTVLAQTCYPFVSALFSLVILKGDWFIGELRYVSYFWTEGYYFVYMQFEWPRSDTMSPREVSV
jgi:hypothetical protein